MLARRAPASLGLCGQSFFIHLLRSHPAVSYRHLSKRAPLPAGSPPSALSAVAPQPRCPRLSPARPAAPGPECSVRIHRCAWPPVPVCLHVVTKEGTCW